MDKRTEKMKSFDKKLNDETHQKSKAHWEDEAELMNSLRCINGGDEVDGAGAKARTIDRIKYKYCMSCIDCGADLKDHVYMIREAMRTGMGGTVHNYKHYCVKCAPEYDYDGCGNFIYLRQDDAEEKILELLNEIYALTTEPELFNEGIKHKVSKLRNTRIATKADCLWCGMTIHNPYRFQTCCSDYCKDKLVNFNKPERIKHERPIHLKDCEQCGTEFTARRSDARFCSKLCKQNAHNAKNRMLKAIEKG